jgi:hypothetical protein
MRCLLRGRLGASVVMHDAGHRHDTSARQDLWAAAIVEDEADPCRIPGPADHDDCMSQRHTAQLGTRIPEWVYDTPLGTAQDKTKWDRHRPDILIATEGKACQGDRIQQLILWPHDSYSGSEVLPGHRQKHTGSQGNAAT